MAMSMGITVMELNYVDLHCHILPNLDDGSPSMTASLAMARQAVADGVTSILATPHHLDRHYTNSAETVKLAVSVFRKELDQEKIALTVYPSQEIHLTGDLLSRLVEGDLLGIDATQKYLLLELPHEMVPSYTGDIIFQLKCRGVVPVIVHPERNAQLIVEPQLLYEFVQQGALAQVTATSLTGGFGREVQRTAKEFVRCGLVQVVASDAHSNPKRQFMMSAAYQELKRINYTYPNQFGNTAQNLLDGKCINLNTIRIPKRQRSFWLF